jgi:hypothetical protein
MVEEKGPRGVLIHFSKPAALWWTDIIDTCGNTMNFFSSEKHLEDWLASNPTKTGYKLTLDQIIKMSKYFYPPRLNLDYERPGKERITSFFDSMGLTGEFWRL